MAAIGFQPPKLYMPGQGKEPDIQPYAPTAITVAGNGVTGVQPIAGDLVTLDTAGNAQALIAGTAFAQGTGANQQGKIVGFAQHGSLDIPFTGIGGAAAITEAALFGAQAMGAIAQGDQTSVHTVLGHNAQPFIVSLREGYAIPTNGITPLPGVQLYLAKDATTGFVVATTLQTNGATTGTLAVTVLGKVLGVNSVVGTFIPGLSSDTGCLIYVTFLPAVLAV